MENVELSQPNAELSTYKRKLVTLRTVLKIEPIANADSLELAHIDGWSCVVGKNTFKEGDVGVYFEVDSTLPQSDSRFAFLSKTFKNHILMDDEWNRFEFEGARIKTMRLRGVVSQGLLMPVKDFPEIFKYGNLMPAKYAELILAKLVVKYEKYIDPTKNGDAKGSFPWFIPKTDQQRVNNLSEEWDSFLDKEVQMTLKLEGTSLTIFKISDLNKYDKHLESKEIEAGEKIYIGVCSKNQELKNDTGSSFWNVVNIHKIPEKMKQLSEYPNLAFQGEFVGPSVQGNYEKVKRPEFFVFNIFDIDSGKYLPPQVAKDICDKLSISHVPVFYEGKLANQVKTIEDMLRLSEGPGMNEGVIREGLVVKALDNSFNFKAISAQFLLL